MEKKKLTTASGGPYIEFDNSMTAGPRGPILPQDYFLHEDLAHSMKRQWCMQNRIFRCAPGNIS